MSDRFDELVGEVEDPAERERLRRLHDVLLSVDPPSDVVAPLRAGGGRRPWPALLAAALAVTSFGLGYAAGGDGGEAEAARVVQMTGVGAERDASASIELLAADAAGNRPLRVRVRGLEPTRAGYDFYELWLTKDGERLGSCGRFKVRAGVTVVSLSVPYPLRDYDGWIVTRGRSERPLLTT